MWSLSLQTNLKLWHSPNLSPPVSLSICLDPRWSCCSACPSERLCTINQHEASLDVEPSDCAWRSNTLFCRVPGVSLFGCRFSAAVSSWLLEGQPLFQSWRRLFAPRGRLALVTCLLCLNEHWENWRSKRHCPEDFTENSLGTLMCTNILWWSFFSTVSPFPKAEENLKKWVWLWLEVDKSLDTQIVGGWRRPQFSCLWACP